MTALPWNSRPIPAGRRPTRESWRHVPVFDWLWEVEGLDHGAAEVYGALVDAAGGKTYAAHQSQTVLARRLRRSTEWVKQKQRLLEDAHLIRPQRPGKGERATRWELLSHPCQPNYWSRNDGDCEPYLGGQEAVELWEEHAERLGFTDALEQVRERFQVDISNGVYRGHALQQLEAFLTAVPEDDSHDGPLGLPRWVTWANARLTYRLMEPDVAVLARSWLRHVRSGQAEMDRMDRHAELAYRRQQARQDAAGQSYEADEAGE